MEREAKRDIGGGAGATEKAMSPRSGEAQRAPLGPCIGGPNNIITSAVAVDLAEHPTIGGNTRSLGTVTGIINGSGSITAALGLMIIGA